MHVNVLMPRESAALIPDLWSREVPSNGTPRLWGRFLSCDRQSASLLFSWQHSRRLCETVSRSEPTPEFKFVSQLHYCVESDTVIARLADDVSEGVAIKSKCRAQFPFADAIHFLLNMAPHDIENAG